jgi:hypothetical protein
LFLITTTPPITPENKQVCLFSMVVYYFIYIKFFILIL